MRQVTLDTMMKKVVNEAFQKMDNEIEELKERQLEMERKLDAMERRIVGLRNSRA